MSHMSIKLILKPYSLGEVMKIMYKSRNTISQDVQTRFPVQLAFAKFLSKIKGNF